MSLISLDDVTKIYPKGTRPALDDITLHIDRGDFVFLVGASGSGKTTLLSLLLREEEATDGEIRVAGNDLRRHHYPSPADSKKLATVMRAVADDFDVQE